MSRNRKPCCGPERVAALLGRFPMEPPLTADRARFLKARGSRFQRLQRLQNSHRFQMVSGDFRFRADTHRTHGKGCEQWR